MVLLIILLFLLYQNNYEYYASTSTEQSTLNPILLQKLKSLTIVVSHTNIMIINNQTTVLCGTDYGLVTYIITPNNAHHEELDIDDDININTTSPDDIIIILKKMNTNLSHKNFNLIKQYGKFNVIRKDENYILVTNKNNTVYFEVSSPDPIYYPFTLINKTDCRINPKNILPPKKYLLYNNHYYDNLERCVHESPATNFALTTTKCIPLTAEEYNQIQTMPRTDECVMGVGTNISMATYNVTKIYSFLDVYKDELVTFFDNLNNKFYFKEGTYAENDFNKINIKSIYVPPDYYVFLITDTDIIPYYGEVHTAVKEFRNKYYNRVITMIIQKYILGNVILCGNFQKKQICMTYNKGLTVFHPRLFIEVLFVKMDTDVTQVSLFEDIASVSLIDTYKNNNTNQTIRVQYPRIVRSINVV